MPYIEDAVIVNALVRQALVAAQEVMGQNGLNTVWVRWVRRSAELPIRIMRSGKRIALPKAMITAVLK